MGIPTISGLTPDSGLPRGGTLVTIQGTNFRVQDDGDDWNEEPAQSVKVTFDGVECDTLWVRSEGLIECIVPPTEEATLLSQDVSTFDVDVVVTNIDNDGLPIASETVTAEEAFTYTKATLNPTTEVYEVETAVVKELINYLKRNLPVAVVLATHPDFKEFSSDPYPQEAEEPAIYLVGPDWERDTIGGVIVGEEFEQSDSEQFRVMEVYFFNFDIVGVSDKLRLVNNLASIFQDTIERAPDLEISYNGGTIYVPIESVTPPRSFQARSSKDGLNQFSASIRLVGVPAKTEKMRKLYETTTIQGEFVRWQSE